MSPYTQDVATLYPGLCASALTLRAGQCVFGEQVVRVNQEQFHFGYIKLYTLLIYRIFAKITPCGSIGSVINYKTMQFKQKNKRLHSDVVVMRKGRKGLFL